LLIESIHTLVDVIIVDPIQIDLVSRVTFSREEIITLMAQVKEELYLQLLL
jgi:hypothetical protein